MRQMGLHNVSCVPGKNSRNLSLKTDIMYLLTEHWMGKKWCMDQQEQSLGIIINWPNSVNKHAIIWSQIWSGACDQESNNHIACFVEWKSRYIILTSKHLHIWRYNTCFQLERLETTCSNSPPHPDKVQILHPPDTEDVQMPVGYPGGEGRGGGCWSFELITM